MPIEGCFNISDSKTLFKFRNLFCNSWKGLELSWQPFGLFTNILKTGFIPMATTRKYVIPNCLSVKDLADKNNLMPIYWSLMCMPRHRTHFFAVTNQIKTRSRLENVKMVWRCNKLSSDFVCLFVFFSVLFFFFFFTFLVQEEGGIMLRLLAEPFFARREPLTFLRATRHLHHVLEA